MSFAPDIATPVTRKQKTFTFVDAKGKEWNSDDLLLAFNCRETKPTEYQYQKANEDQMTNLNGVIRTLNAQLTVSQEDRDRIAALHRDKVSDLMDEIELLTKDRDGLKSDHALLEASHKTLGEDLVTEWSRSTGRLYALVVTIALAAIGWGCFITIMVTRK